MQTGIELITKERQEQIEKHGRTIESDVEYNDNYELTDAVSMLIKNVAVPSIFSPMAGIRIFGTGCVINPTKNALL